MAFYRCVPIKSEEWKSAVQNAVFSSLSRYIPLSGAHLPSSRDNVVYIPIPSGVTKITIKNTLGTTIAYNDTTRYSALYKEVPYTSGIAGLVKLPLNVSEVTFNLNDGYSYVGITILKANYNADSIIYKFD